MNATMTATSPTAIDASWERFEALYRSSRDDVYAYVATLLREPRRRRGRDRARVRARLPPPPLVRPRARRTSAPGCSGSRATPRSTSCAAAGATRRSPSIRRTRRGDALAAPTRTSPTTRCAAPPCAPRSTGSPPRERELVALKFHAGLSNAEIARVLGVSESNAGTLLHRTIAKLRKACDA